MTALESLKFMLAYKKVDKDNADKYVRAVEILGNEFVIDPIKSLYFNNNLDNKRKIAVKGSREISGEVPGVGTVVFVQYGVADEDANRYAIFSEEFSEPLFIRAFTDRKRFDSFLRASKIDVLDKFEFKNTEIVMYHSDKSNRDRYAVYAPEDIHITEEEFAKIGNKERADNPAEAKETAVFGTYGL